MTVDELRTCLNGIEQDLAQNNYDDAFLLLNTLMCHAVRCGYKMATDDLAVWKDEERYVGVLEKPIASVFEQIDNSTVTIGDTTVLSLGCITTKGTER